jgi:hypothetical protein
VTPATDSAAAQLGARRSSTFPSLQWSNLHDFKPGSINAAQGIDLGLQLGLEGSGFTIHGSGLRTSPASSVPGARAGPGLRHLAHKLRGFDVMLTRGSRWPELQRKMAGGEILQRRRVGVRGEGCCRGSPGSWSPWIDAWGSCKGAEWVNRACGPPVASNCGGGSAHLLGSSGKFRPRNGPRSRMKGAGAPG